MRITVDAEVVKISAAQRSGIALVATIFAYLFLQVALGIFYWLPTHSVGIALRPNLDALFIVSLLLLLASLPWPRVRSITWLPIAIAPLVAIAVLLGIAQGIARRSFAYDFTLAYHTQKVKALLTMMYDAQSLLVFLLSMSLLLVLIVGVIVGAAWAIRRLNRIAQTSAEQRLRLAGVLGIHTLVAGLSLGFNGPVSLEIRDQLSEAYHREKRVAEQADEITMIIRRVEAIAFDEDARRPTVLVFVVESYGQVLFEAEKYRAFHKVIADAETELLAAGYSIRSRIYKAPVFGGSSWLANATFLCRMVIPTEKMYFSLLKTSTPCLPRAFNEGGYQSVFAGSNTLTIDEEYKTLFPFEDYFTHESFPYAGPRMSWSYMPDQYIIDQIEKQLLSKTSNRPRFVYFKLSSSHHPWDTIPPFFEDWSTVDDGSIYKTVSSKRYNDNAFLGGKHLNEGYYDATVYSLTTIFSYLNKMPRDRDVVAVVFGDHQPRDPVGDMENDPWTVPLHVLSRDPELIARFESIGYTPGLFTGNSSASEPGLETIANDLFVVLNDASEGVRRQ